MITRNLSLDAMRIEDIETQVKLIVKNGYFKGYNSAKVQTLVQKYITKELPNIESRELRQKAFRSLTQLALQEYRLLRVAFGINGVLAFSAIALARKGKLTREKAQESGLAGLNTLDRIDRSYPEPLEFGMPTQKYSKDYMAEVNKAMTKVAKLNGLDPDDVTGRNSLRNLAEMQTRFESHEKDIDRLKKAGTRLVVCSVHQDCSDRCYPWQGRVYSLDGTSGKTEDGREFVPLETATDVFYTTKAGKTYKNGLLGFNCRHKLTEYKVGMRIPHVSKATQERENAINRKQRQYENEIRKYRSIALFSEDEQKRKIARKKATELNKEYVAFSHSHGRAYYPDRVKILFDRG